jgi:hypothetical protein
VQVNSGKRDAILASLKIADFDSGYELASPTPRNRYSFKPQAISEAFLTWPRVVDLCSHAPIPGLQEMRRGSSMASERKILEGNMSKYLDPKSTWEQLSVSRIGPTRDAGRFNAQESRERILKREKYEPNRILKYSLYPFDIRWAYWSSVRPLWNEPRPGLALQLFPGNKFFVTRVAAERPDEGVPATMSAALPDYHLLRPNVVAIPITIQNQHDDLLAAGTSANLSTASRGYLETLGVPDPDHDASAAALMWLHSLSVCHTRRYLAENRDGVLADWPHIPLPAARERLEASAALGRKIASLLDLDESVEGVTTGKVTPELVKIGVPQRLGGGQISSKEMRLTAGWGHAGREGITMPGRGRRIERSYSSDERAAIAQAADRLKIDESEVAKQLGLTTGDVYLNETAYWSNIPSAVWDFTIGGYQVMKKWLSYREYDLLGRALTLDEIREVTNMARRIVAILLLQPALDANYRDVIGDTYSWPAI